MSDRSFRRRLREELPAWVDEGVIDAPAAQRIRDRYRLDAPGTPLVVVAAYVLGGLLVGGGIVSLVAWHWDELPDALKLAGGGALLAGLHLAGARLREAGGRPLLGQGLLFLATLVFGADIGLVAQVFHVHSNWYGGIGAWALGALVAAWAYRCVPTAVLAAALAFTWSCGYSTDDAHVLPLAPFAITATLVPLAWRLRSSIVAALAVPAAGLAIVIAAGHTGDSSGVVLSASFAVALLFLGLARALPRTDAAEPFAKPLAVCGLIALVLAAYVASYHDALDSSRALDLWQHPEWAWVMAPTAIGGLVAAARAARKGALAGRASDVVSLACAFALLATCLALGAIADVGVGDLHDRRETLSLVLAVVANLGLAAIAVVSIRTALVHLERRPFWFGSLLAGTVIVTRFFELKTDLLVKGLCFIACGVAVILIGTRFERRLKQAAAIPTDADAGGSDHA